jgi:AcrR family transcriptional regulator
MVETIDSRSLQERILDATVGCIAGHGVARTTIDDIARAAGCGRATVYRAFAGGKDAVVVAAGARELERFLDRLGTRVDACDTLEDAIVTGLTATSRELLGHEAFVYLVEHEPAVVRPMLAFDGLDPLLARAGAFTERHLARFLAPAPARLVGEWAARLVLCYAHDHVPGEPAVDLADGETARRIVRTFLLAGPIGRRSTNPHTVQEQ